MKIPVSPLLPNFYLLALGVFFIWMLLFDSNDFISQYQKHTKLKEMEAEKAYYLQRIEEVKKDRKELLSNAQLLEKFAREKYLMKREKEEVFVVVDENNDPLE